MTGDIYEFNGSRNDLFRVVHLSENIEPVIRHRYDSTLGSIVQNG